MDFKITKCLSIYIAFCLFFLLMMEGNKVITYADDQVTNPFSFTVTDLDSDGYFTVNINIAEDCVIEAYKLSVSYDSAYGSLKEGRFGYGNYKTFLNKFSNNNLGLCVNNHLKESSKIIFTGVQPDKESCALNSGDRVAYMTFQFVSGEGENEKTFEDAVNSISMKIENYYDGEIDYVKQYPDVFSENITPVSGDDLRGEKPMLGDYDANGKVDLVDATNVLKASVGIILNLNADEKAVADVDGDSSITLMDATLVLKYAVGIIHSFDEAIE